MGWGSDPGSEIYGEWQGAVIALSVAASFEVKPQQMLRTAINATKRNANFLDRTFIPFYALIFS